MNTKALLLGSIVAVLATAAAFAGNGLLSPRAQGNQIKVVSAQAPTAGITINYVDSLTPVSARAQAAQIKVVKGIVTDCNPALECIQNMQGTPRVVTACSQSVTMPGCKKLVAAK